MTFQTKPKPGDDIRLYHTDHLGSTALVTDIDGDVTQHVAYIPYGEVFVEQRNGSWNTPYFFNAKELDEETGLYYYGARYLDPTNVTWLSVDPLWEKYVGMSPYGYCAGNPVRLVDVDGRDWIKAEYEGETFYYFDENIHSQEDIKRLYYDNEDRTEYGISYFGAAGSFSSEADGDFCFKSDGTYTHNGQEMSSEYSNDGSLHVGSSKFTNLHEEKQNNNWYGNYLGPNNPRNQDNTNYSYAILPIDDLDYAAYLHDKGYDTHGAEGKFDALLNWSVVDVDWNLVRRCHNVSSDGSKRKQSWASKTAFAFTYLALKKEQNANPHGLR